MPIDGTRDEPVSPLEWERRVRLPPVLAARVGGEDGCSLRRWVATPRTVAQPRLDHHYVVLHLGGAKRVARRGEGRSVVADVPANALTIVPEGARFDWRTEGPIDYAHFYVPAKRLAACVEEVFDRDARAVELQASVGAQLPAVAATFGALLEEAANPWPTPLYAETLADAMLALLVRGQSNLSPATRTRTDALAPFKQRRLKDYIEAHLAEPITLDALAAEAELSRFHFARSFARSLGLPPHAYVNRRRAERARMLLQDDALTLAEIARQCGFSSERHLVAQFRRMTGRTPARYRRERG